jgi:hypothetical protein
MRDAFKAQFPRSSRPACGGDATRSLSSPRPRAKFALAVDAISN